MFKCCYGLSTGHRSHLTTPTCRRKRFQHGFSLFKKDFGLFTGGYVFELAPLRYVVFSLVQMVNTVHMVRMASSFFPIHCFFVLDIKQFAATLCGKSRFRNFTQTLNIIIKVHLTPDSLFRKSLGIVFIYKNMIHF